MIPRTICTILSTNYSGSHFLSLTLGSHSQACHIGEIAHLRRSHDSARTVCASCDPQESCPLIRGISPDTIQDVYEIIFANLGDPATRILVDASKKVHWAHNYCREERYRMRYVHLIRDPRALARRWLLTYESRKDRYHVRFKTARRHGPRFLPVLLSPAVRLYTYKWLYQNRKITEFLRSADLESTVVTYRDMALEPQKTTKHIMEWLGVPFEPGQLEYWNFPHHGSQKQDYDWVKKQKTRYFDVRWKELFTTKQMEFIVNTPRVGDYLRELNLEFTDDGLRSRRLNR